MNSESEGKPIGPGLKAPKVSERQLALVAIFSMRLPLSVSKLLNEDLLSRVGGEVNDLTQRMIVTKIRCCTCSRLRPLADYGEFPDVTRLVCPRCRKRARHPKGRRR